MAACSVRRNSVGPKGHVWEVWKWFSGSFCVEKFPSCILLPRFGSTILSKVAGIIMLLKHSLLLLIAYSLCPILIAPYKKTCNFPIKKLSNSVHNFLNFCTKLKNQSRSIIWCKETRKISTWFFSRKITGLFVGHLSIWDGGSNNFAKDAQRSVTYVHYLGNAGFQDGVRIIVW